MKTVAAFALALSLIVPRNAASQRSATLAVSVDRVSLSGIIESSSRQISLRAEGNLTPLHGLEIAMGHLEETQTQGNWHPSQGEAPYTVGFEAYPVQLSYVLFVPNLIRPVQPFFRIGGDWVRLKDTYRSDTPEESFKTSFLGGHTGAGIRAMLGPFLWCSIGGEYRVFREDHGRPPLAINLNGWALRGSIGLRISE